MTGYAFPRKTVPETLIPAYSYNKRRLLNGQGEALTRPNWYRKTVPETLIPAYSYNKRRLLNRKTVPETLSKWNKEALSESVSGTVFLKCL